MPDIDTSQYPKARNPLETITGFANLQNTLNQNKLFQQQFQTNKAVSDIYKRAVKPDGTLDMDQIRAAVAENPDAGYGLEQVFKGAQGLQQGQIATDTAQLENLQAHLKAATPYFARIAKPGSTSREVLTEAANALTSGVINTNQYVKLLATLPKDQSGNVIESKIPEWGQQRLLQFMQAADQMSFYNPKPQFEDVPGGGKAAFSVSAGGGVNQVSPIIPGAPTPTQTYTDPSGQPRAFGNVAGTTGWLPGYGGPQGGGAPAQAGGQAGAPAPSGNIAGTSMGMSPAAQAASQKSGGDSAEQLGALRSEVGGSANRVLQLQNASAALEVALTGKGSQKIQDLRALLVTSGLATDAVAEKVKNFDEAKKYLLGSMLNRGAGLGINTNEKLAALSGASPNTDISQLAAKDIIRTNIGLEKAQQAQYAAFKNSGLPPEQFTDWAAQWNTGRDLRAYSMAQKPAAERKKFVEGLKPAERAKFAATLTEGVRLGILPLSDFAK